MARKEELSAAWDAARAAWRSARDAKWTPGKAARVAELAAVCSAARRAFYAAEG